MKDKTLSTPRIRVTTDYNLFKHYLGNRKIYKDHLAKLERAILGRNLLPYNPIVVDKNFAVIDGQHRLEICKTNNLPVYYVLIPEDVFFEDITMLNNEMRRWTINDYLNIWIERGNPEYKKVLEFSKKYGVTIPNAASFLFVDGETERFYFPQQVFITGQFEIADEKFSHEFAAFWQSLGSHANKQVRHHRDFLRAIYKIYINEDIDKARLVEKVKGYPVMEIRLPGYVEYLRHFEDIYNDKLVYKTRFY